MLKLHILSAFLISLVYSAPLDAPDDVTYCLRDFYQAIYTRSYHCTKEYDFLSNDTVTEKNAYNLGKECFLSIIREKCSNSVYILIEFKYDQIVETITGEPENGTSCIDLHYTYNAQKCSPIIKDFSKSRMINSDILDIINLCDKLQTCMSPTCYYLEESKIKVSEVCKQYQLMNSPFSDCMTILQKYPPPSSKYSCLHGRAFNVSETETYTKDLTIHKDCTKEIMKDSCGEKALENFDEYADVSVKRLQIMKAFTV